MSPLSSFSQTHFFSYLPGMEYQYIFGGILAYILVFVLYNFAEKKKASGSMQVESNGFAKASENGTCSREAEGSTEIIIIGAGVVGAALAYTRGKESCYAMMKCIKYGHEIVALANLLPAMSCG